MAKSKVVKEVPVCSPLDFTADESALISRSSLREYRAYEAKKIGDFAENWSEKFLAADKQRHEALAKHKEKLKPGEDEIPGAQIINTTHEKTRAKLVNDRAKKWGGVLKDLRKVKAQVVFNAKEDMLTQCELDPEDRVPREGRWITFPLCNTEGGCNGEIVTIRWIEANTIIEERYYKTTCWYGTLEFDAVVELNPIASNIEAAGDNSDAPDVGENPDGSENAAVAEEPATAPTHRWKASARLNPFGEATLFIAAEFIEQRYQGGPHLRGLHLRDKFPPGTNWAYMRIDHAFHYGQDDKTPSRRYLVYHPFVRTRNIPQAAFALNVRVQTAKSATKSAAASKTAIVAQIGSILSGVTDLAVSLMEHKLRRFDPLNDDDRLYDVSEEIRKLEKKWNAEDTSLEKHFAQVSAGLCLARTLENASVKVSRASEHEPALGVGKGVQPMEGNASDPSNPLESRPLGHHGEGGGQDQEAQPVNGLDQRDWHLRDATNTIEKMWPYIEGRKNRNPQRAALAEERKLPTTVSEEKVADRTSALARIMDGNEVTENRLKEAQVNIEPPKQAGGVAPHKQKFGQKNGRKVFPMPKKLE